MIRVVNRGLHVYVTGRTNMKNVTSGICGVTVGFRPVTFRNQPTELICSSDSASASISELSCAYGMRPALTVWPPAHLKVVAACLLEQSTCTGAVTVTPAHNGVPLCHNAIYDATTEATAHATADAECAQPLGLSQVLNNIVQCL